MHTPGACMVPGVLCQNMLKNVEMYANIEILP